MFDLVMSFQIRLRSEFAAALLTLDLAVHRLVTADVNVKLFIEWKFLVADKTLVRFRFCVIL